MASYMLLFSLAAIAAASPPTSRPRPVLQRLARPPATATSPAATTTRPAAVDVRLGVTELVATWKNTPDADVAYISQACAKADDSTASMILEAVRELSRQGNPKERRRAMAFFGEPCRMLAERVTDVEPVLRLAVDTGWWNAIVDIPCEASLREKYLIEGVRTCRRQECGPSLASITAWISDSRIPELRDVMRALRHASPESDGFRIALRTLVELDAPEILNDVQGMVSDVHLSPQQREYAQTYLAKLRDRDSVSALVDIVRKERQNRILLKWAIRRLLWLRESPASIGNGRGHVASAMKILLSPPSSQPTEDTCRGAAPPDADWLILGRAELRQVAEEWRRARESGDTVRQLEIMMRYDTRTLVHRAAPGQ
jgi:hypothetical protein